MAVAHVLEKTIDYRSRHHVSDTLRDVAAVTLKRDPDHFRLLHHRATAVARINLRTDLNREVLIDRRVGVKLEIDPRNNTASFRHPLPAHWIHVTRTRF